MRRLGLGRIAYNKASYTQKSPTQINRFRELSGLVLLRHDNLTQLNSWNNILETLLRPEVRHAIQIYVDENWLLEEYRLERRE